LAVAEVAAEYLALLIIPVAAAMEMREVAVTVMREVTWVRAMVMTVEVAAVAAITRATTEVTFLLIHHCSEHLAAVTAGCLLLPPVVLPLDDSVFQKPFECGLPLLTDCWYHCWCRLLQAPACLLLLPMLTVTMQKRPLRTKGVWAYPLAGPGVQVTCA
jgi:hypothetical protein